jgi:serine/threonine protein kinase
VVSLTLWPVGAQWDNLRDEELIGLALDILRTLVVLHDRGIVHRDIRRENIVRSTESWVLIDWEMAGPADEKVWWRSQGLPDSVRHGDQPYTRKADLWQVGKLLLSTMVRPSRLEGLANSLIEGSIESATDCLDVVAKLVVAST